MLLDDSLSRPIPQPTPQPISRALLFGDSSGIPDLLSRLPKNAVAGIVASSVRPQHHGQLRALADGCGVPMIVHPRAQDAETGDFLRQLEALAPDGLICHSYAMRIGRPVLDLVHGLAFNLHWSLLPRHRGPNPIQWSLIHGDDVAGATIHLMDDDFDTGSIVGQSSIPIDPADTWVSLHQRLATCARELLDAVLPAILDGRWTAVAQDERDALRNPRISPDSFAIDFATMGDREIANLIRAQVAPLAGAHLDTTEGQRRFPEPLSLFEVAQLRRQQAPETVPCCL